MDQMKNDNFGNEVADTMVTKYSATLAVNLEPINLQFIIILTASELSYHLLI